jgi:hypothetical protein
VILALARVLLRLELRRRERAVGRPFDREASAAIDRLRTALEALGG